MHFPLDCCDFSETSGMMLEGLIRFLSEDIDFKAIVFLILAGVSVVISTGYQLYTKIRPRFAVAVNCWFCNSDSKTHFNNRNSWTCPKCHQYNGFTQSGDYNKPIPEQSYEGLNRTVQSVKLEPFTPSQNGLCRKCNINQELKVQQLASFVPIKKANFDEEIELYRQRLERAYRLCAECDGKLNSKLNSVKNWIHNLYPPKSAGKIEDASINQAPFTWTSFLLRLLSTVASVMMCILAATEINKIKILWTVPSVLKLSSKLSLPLNVLNFGLALLATAFAKPRLRTNDLIASSLWLLVAILNLASTNLALARFKKQTLSAYIVTSVIASLVTVIVHIQYLRNKKDVRQVKEKDEADLKIEEKAENFVESNTTADVPEANSNKNPPTPTVEKSSVLESPMKPVQSSLNSLTLGPSLPKSPSPSIFEPRVYQHNSNTNLFCPIQGSELRCRKPIVHPPKFNPWNNSYCGSMSIPISRSSSQSSGFASQNGTNYSSLPNSRSGSVCGDVDRFSVLSEPIYPSASFKPFNPHFYVPCVPQFYLPTAPVNLPAQNLSPVSTTLNSTQSSNNSSMSEPVINNVTSIPDKTVFSLMRDNFGLATVFLCSIVFNLVVIALAVSNTLSAPVH